MRKKLILLALTITLIGVLCLVPLSLTAQVTAVAGGGLAPTVTGATIDLETYNITVQLQNVSDKAVVAYSLETVALDAQGNKVGEFQRGLISSGPNQTLERCISSRRDEPPQPTIPNLNHQIPAF